MKKIQVVSGANRLDVQKIKNIFLNRKKARHLYEKNEMKKNNYLN